EEVPLGSRHLPPAASDDANPGVLLGSAALGLGVLGFAALWSPALSLVGVALAGLGLLLGLCLCLWAGSRGPAAYGFPVAGAVARAQALVVAAVLLWQARAGPVPGSAEEGGAEEPPPPGTAAARPTLEDVPPLLKRADLARLLIQKDNL